MSDQNPEHMNVFFSEGVVLDEFRKWVANNGWHLQGPYSFNDADPEDTTYFVQPGRDEEELGRMIRGMM